MVERAGPDGDGVWPPVPNAVSPMATIYMLRTVQQHHVQLSVMADVKASILITAASILVTAFVALTSSLGIEPGVVAATPLVLASLGFAIYPKGAPAGGPRLGAHGFNLFFFGHFGTLSQDEFVSEMMNVISDPEDTYVHQIIDIYQLGAYLQSKKYRYLRWSYSALFIGVAVGAVTEIVAVLV